MPHERVETFRFGGSRGRKRVGMAYREEFEQGAQGMSASVTDRKPARAPEAEQAAKGEAPGAPALKDAAPPKAKSRKKPVIMAILLGAAAFGSYEGYHWWTDGRFMVSTDDAYV